MTMDVTTAPGVPDRSEYPHETCTYPLLALPAANRAHYSQLNIRAGAGSARYRAGL
jgi:hypothetical protein